MTQTKAALHEAVDQLDDAEAEAILEAIRTKRVDAHFAGVEEVEPDEWDREAIAGITSADVRETISADDLRRELGI
ncbi:MAG TPA: hypothetical protein VIJ77_12355 [Candidatus Tumulicola sp.]